MPLILVTKGIEWNETSFKLLPDLLVEGMPTAVRPTLHPVAVTGPCIAGELIRRRETCVIFSGRDASAVRAWNDAASTPYYHVWESAAFAACQASAALKNAFAIAVGFASGAVKSTAEESNGSSEPQGVGAHNYESAVFAESMVEMAQLVELVGGAPFAVVGLAGAGDLQVTTHARSVRLGRLLGLGRSLDEALEEMAGVTLEGVATIRAFARALDTLDASGRTEPQDFPLMRHLIDVVSGEPVRVPFDRFFGGLRPR
jgi:glycerol-3-phosphate dehydrogenase (NAD(P)+)